MGVVLPNKEGAACGAEAAPLTAAGVLKLNAADDAAGALLVVAAVAAEAAVAAPKLRPASQNILLAVHNHPARMPYQASLVAGNTHMKRIVQRPRPAN